LQTPSLSSEAGTPLLQTRFAFFKFSVARTLCEGNLLSLIFAQPGHWLGPVTGPGWRGLAQPMWAELGPAPKNKRIKKNKI
jgi:hypothetical protein